MTEIQLRTEGMRILRDQLGLVESERFVALLLREKFDYTKWRETKWNDETVDELWERAKESGLDKAE